MKPNAIRSLPPALAWILLSLLAGTCLAQSGTLTATPNPCANLPGTNYCSPLLSWTSSGLGADTPYVQVRLADQTIQCAASNAVGSHQLVNIKVGTNGKTFTLWATSDCTTFPFVKYRLDDEYARNSSPQGRIWATPNPCVIPAGEPGCKPFVKWDSLNLTGPKVIVAVNGSVFSCSDANVPGEKQIVNFVVGGAGKTFALYEASNCRTAGVPQTAPLATVLATGLPTGTPVCSLDDQPLSSTVGPEFFGIIENHKGFQGSGPVGQIAQHLDAAEFRHLRRTVRWNIVQKVPPGPGGSGFDWSFYDSFLAEFATRDIEPWITLSHTPAWAVTHVACDDQVPGNECRRFAPTDIEDWRTFVHEAILRYGPSSSYGVRNWEVWQEPDFNFLDPPSAYVELVETAYDEIADLEPLLGAMNLWAPNTVFYPDQPDREAQFLAFVNPLLASGAFDGLAVHTFQTNSERNVYSVEYSRALLDAHGYTTTPVAVTAASFGGGAPGAWQAMSGEDQATYLRDAYVCLANAGASNVMWFNATDTPLPCDPEGPPSDERGVLELVCDSMGQVIGFVPDPYLYPVVQEIGAYLNP